MSEKERAHRGAVRKCITQVEQAPTTSAYGYIVASNRCVVEASCRVPLQSSSSPSKSNSQRNVSIPKQSKEAQAPVEASCLAGIQSELFASDNVYTQMHTHTHTRRSLICQYKGICLLEYYAQMHQVAQHRYCPLAQANSHTLSNSGC